MPCSPVSGHSNALHRDSAWRCAAVQANTSPAKRSRMRWRRRPTHHALAASGLSCWLRGTKRLSVELGADPSHRASLDRTSGGLLTKAKLVFHVLMPGQFLDDAGCDRLPADAWRKGWQPTGFVMPARLTATFTARCSAQCARCMGPCNGLPTGTRAAMPIQNPPGDARQGIWQWRLFEASCEVALLWRPYSFQIYGGRAKVMALRQVQGR